LGFYKYWATHILPGLIQHAIPQMINYVISYISASEMRQKEMRLNWCIALLV
jgi:hypothetical protein